MLGSDFFFTIGSTHKICQDYAVASPDGDYVILSDGCSSALDTDIGSRLLVKSVQAFVRLEDTQAMLAYTIARADACARVLGLPRTCLSATLLIARLRDDAIETIVAGDGIVAARRKADGALLIYRYEYESGAPFYPSYTLSQESLKEYLGKFDRVRQCSLTILQPFCDPKGYDWTEDAGFFTGPAFPLEDFDLCALFSDGVASFSAEAGALSVPDIVRKFLDFKTLKGQFVQRRCRRALEQFQQDNQAPADDFSMAAIASIEERV